MKYIDSNILAYAFYDNEYTTKCQQAINDGGLTNTLNLIEAFFIIEKETTRERAAISIKGLLKSNIEIIDVDINLIFESLKKANESRLSVFDLVHYATASSHNCTSILSYDDDFDNLNIPREEP